MEDLKSIVKCLYCNQTYVQAVDLACQNLICLKDIHEMQMVESNFESLYLSNNQLTSLDPSTFNNLTKLEELHLSKNQLLSLDHNTFKRI